MGSLQSALPGIRVYTETPFRLTPPRGAVVIPAAAVPPLPVERVERFLELSKRSPGLSRRARRRRRGERAAILEDLAR
ncbi:hypothetical protein [Methylobacterium sp. MA0201]|uniref:hypothetical protein n=1 Tax=Methylobacterium alsaeris TaxID=3344826 RepID=UPI003756D567